MYALVDGNNFYVACERVFQPRLSGRPVVVLSNNDGCAISRSDEAKALGVRMAQPWHEIRHLEATAGLIALSANFPLYGDMSDRMMAIAAGLGPAQEIYSIDESFIGLAGVRGDLTQRAWAIRARILQWTGLPCGIGLGATKTLAKLANHTAKTAERRPGSLRGLATVCNFAALPPSDLDALWAATDVGAVWGVGRRIGQQLHAAGIHNVLDLARLSPALVRKRWSVVLERTVRELQGESCIRLEDAPSAPQQIACTRSFGRPVSALPALCEAVSSFASQAAHKLRLRHLQAASLLVFAHTSPFRPGPRFSQSIVVPLLRPTADSRLLVQAALAATERIYQPGFALAKAGVMLLDLRPEGSVQAELGYEPPEARDKSGLMAAMDALNRRYGAGTVHVASTPDRHTASDWAMRQQRLSPQYTTRWSDLPIARA